MTQDMKIDMILHTITKRLVRNGRTLSPSRANSQYVPCVLKTMLLLLMLFVGVGEMWGQLPSVSTSNNTNFYKINLGVNNSNANYRSNYFMTPSSPKVSIKDNPGNGELWYVIETDDTPTGTFSRDHIDHYCYIVNALSGQRLYYTGTNSNSIETNVVEMRTFGAEGNETDRFKFIIKKSGNSSTNNYWMFPKIAAENNNTQYESNSYGFLALGVKQNTTYANGLTLSKEKNGVWSSQWVFVSASLFDAPTITFNNTTNQFTISHSFLSSGCTIYYTTDNSTPSSSWTPYTEAVNVSTSATVRAVVIRDNIVLTDVGSLAVSPAIEAPVVTNNFDGTISLSCSTTGALIYYTTDGTTPSNSNGTLYSSAFALGNATVISAIAYNSTETLSSSVTTYNVPQYTAPTIRFNDATSQVTITSEGTVYYTTDNSTPTTSGTAYSAPFTVSSATTIKAIATHAGYLTSEVATLAITQVATPTIQNNGSNAISITCATEGATIYYTTDGSTPTTSSTEYTGPLTENVSGVTIKAIAVKENMISSAVRSGTVTLQCEAPVIVRSSNTSFTVTCAFPSSGVTIYYTTGDGTQAAPTTSSNSVASGGTVTVELPTTVKAMAVATNYDNSEVTTTTLTLGMDGDGSAANPYTIEYQSDVEDFISKANTPAEASKHYKVTATTSLDFSSAAAITEPFTGTFDGGFQTISNLGHALFNTIDGGTVKNVTLRNVNISSGTNVGAICNEATGASRIYNCGILPTTVLRNDPDDEYKITGFSGSSIGGSGNVGGIVGLLSGNARVINCYSYATITEGATVGGIVGNIGYGADESITQATVGSKPMVVNCMFYGDITGGTSISPVYGGASGAMIKNETTETVNNNEVGTGVNPYCYFRGEASFNNKTNFPNIDSYKRSWPAEEKNLTRFEYYRSILNSNKRLCTWWVNGTNNTAPSDADVNSVGIAKWVLDPSIAPYPILKEWGKYPSIINPDPDKRTDPSTKAWIDRDDASSHWGTHAVPDTDGQILGSITVSIDAGGVHHTGTDSRTINITAMDKESYDYCYGKIQLPYYNEIFGNPNGETWSAKYGDNYGEYVVTGWEITTITGGTPGTFDGSSDHAWEDGYNFSDRNCTNKDKYSVSGRVFAQGGYYYVPDGVTSISIKAHWGKAVYLANRGYSIDRVRLTKVKITDNDHPNKVDLPFSPAGTVGATFQTSYTVYNDLQDAIKALGEATVTNNIPSLSVYDQAIVLIGNHQVQNASQPVGYEMASDHKKWHPFTIMSADFDFDNEPDYCLQLQFRNHTDRPGIQPIRFDFLPVVELGLAVRPDEKAYAIGVFIPQGHFEITETAFMRTTQFEWDCGQDGGSKRITNNVPVILNGGEFEQLSVRYPNKNGPGSTGTRTGYFLLGGHVWFHRFAPGAHPHKDNIASPRLCVVNAIGGDFPEFYLSGLYKPNLSPREDQGNPHCYIDGGNFGYIYGAGYDKVKGNVTFKINHSLIEEFYGGGINGSNPIGGNIDVTIDNSKVTKKYCGGPVVGDMTDKTVTTHATGTTFGVFYGGGNGGNSYYRALQWDGDRASSYIGTWTDQTLNWNGFTPLTTTYDDGSNDSDKKENKGYHAEYEFEVFNQSNGLRDQITQRGFIKWIQFGITKTGNVTNTLTDCKILNNFYGGGNLATVDGTVTSTLTDTEVDGDVFGAGYSAAIPTFQVHDKDNKNFPEMDFAGTITDGHIPYASTVYEWTNDLNGMSEADRKASPTYSKSVNGETKWYCYTWNSLENLGAVTGTATLNINGTTTVAKSVYGGGEQSAVNTNTVVTVNNGTIGTNNLGGATYGNVYGGGKGKAKNETGENYNDLELVKMGLVKGNTNVTINGGTILHNVYGGGAFGSVGNFTFADAAYNTAHSTTLPLGTIVDYTNGGTANVTITGGTIGTTGDENGMVFGSSRGDVETPTGSPAVDINDRLAWVHDTHVIIGTAGQGADAPQPQIKGSVYGSGENGHTYQNTIVDIHSGTIGITEGATITTDDNGTPDDDSDDTKYSGAAYPYRGNVYGGGCGTDKYASVANGPKDTYNPLAGIVLGNATVNIDGGLVVHNVYGAGAMGSVGKTDNTGAITSGGTTTIAISGGTIGVDGTAGDGNVFGAARGDKTTKQTGIAQVLTTGVTISGGAVMGNVYGGGEIGNVGTFYETAPSDGRYLWTSGGRSTVTVTGGRIGPENNTNSKIGNVFGAGKGEANTFKCEKAMVKETVVSISNGTVWGNVYGGGEIGRVEYDTEVTIGRESGEEEGAGTGTPDIKGSVFGGGAGAETHGYSALVRGNTTVTVEGAEGSKVGHNVYGGGEIASVGRYGLDGQKMPEILLAGGQCVVKVLGNAQIGPENASDDFGNVFGAGKGVTPHFNKNSGGKDTWSRRMVTYDPYSLETPKGRHTQDNKGTLWWPFDEAEPTPTFVWEYFPDDTEKTGEAKYATYLETLALATHPEVTINGSPTVNGSVFGGGELGLTKGSVVVNILGGTIVKDVYGGGSLANTNTTSTVGVLVDGVPQRDENNDYETTTFHPTTAVNLKGGQLRDAYGGGLGVHDIGEVGKTGYVAGTPAYVYGDVTVKLNEGVADDEKGCIVNHVFGCNNLKGTPKKKVKVYVYATQKSGGANISAKTPSVYDVQAVYGGGNLAPYDPIDASSDDETIRNAAKTEVYIEGCQVTSIKQVYGGGNAAPVPATFVEITSAYEIDEAFGGGNGADDYYLMEPGEVWYKNPGANVGYYTYASYLNEEGQREGSGTEVDPWKAFETSKFSGGSENKGNRLSTTDPEAIALRYGSGIATLRVEGGKINAAYGGSNSKGNVRAKLISVYSASNDCAMQVGQSYGGGKNAYSDADAEVAAECAKGIREMFGGSRDADFDGNINLTITNGSSLERVFGGNNTSGAVNGSITVTIEEGGCEPIHIGELYLGGYLAPYSVYGYDKNGDGSYKTEEVEYLDEHNVTQTKLQRIPLEIGTRLYADPRINVISATRIDNIYGGGYQAKLVGNPHINVNMTTGVVKVTKTEKAATDETTYDYEYTDGGKTYIYKDASGTVYSNENLTSTDDESTFIKPLQIGSIGNIYGGGNMADIVGSTYVEIGTGTEHNAAGTETVTISPARNAANITGSVFGGGNQADVSVNTYVTMGNGSVDGSVYGGGKKGNVGKYTKSGKDYVFDTGSGITNVTITGGTIGPENNTDTEKGNVFGGGMGEALESGAGAFMCEKAMVDYTHVVINNGTVNGTVYGGGEIGRVNHDTEVTIGVKRENDTDPAVSTPVVEGNVYGAGKGRSTHGYAALVRGNSYVTVQGDAKVKDCVYGGGEIASVGKYSLDAADMPQSLANNNSGYCTVIVQDNAEIGPDNPMSMITTSGYPDDKGHVFGAGKGILPYEGYTASQIPWRVKGNNTKQQYGEGVYTYDPEKENPDYKKAYLTYIETQGLATQTYVTIAGNALVKGSVYGGSMNGHVQHDTNVTIAGGQIGCQKGTAERLPSTVWTEDPSSVTEDYECASWDFTGDHLPYDIYDYQAGKPKPATDGHTFFGNVFGGGSGYYPYAQNPDLTQAMRGLGYADGLWHREAGSVGGNTVVNITGGHILTSVYGGNEQTDVGTYVIDANGDRIPIAGTGHCTINMSGGTVGVPRNEDQIKAHPVTCYIFGAGKGDQRINFNNWTNVASTQVNISGNARIYGSTFGGGEDGHVVGDAETNIGGNFNMNLNDVETPVSYSDVTIGSTGTSGADGNIFGGGRGFSETALTAGVVGGSVRVNIHGGKMLGTVFGGGRLASVGTYFANAENENYGMMQNAKTEKTLYTAEEASAYNTMHNLTSSDPGYIKAGDIKTPEIIHGNITVTIDGGTIGATDGSGKLATSDFSIGDVFGGCKGSTNDVRFGMSKNTTVYISGANTKVNGNVYGGGEAGDVGTITRNLTNYNYTWKDSDGENNTAGNNGVTGTNKNSGICTVNITGGTIGDGQTDTKGNVFGAGRGVANTWWCEKAMAYATNVSISGATKVNGSVFGGGEVGRVEDDTKVTIGTSGGSDTPEIKGSVFGAGAGLATHGYSALVRGNSEVTVQGKAKVGVSVYGGGEIATVGRYVVVKGVPKEPDGGGSCTVIVKDDAEIAEDVFGAGQGVDPATYSSSGANISKRMMLYDSSRDTGTPSSSTWEYADSEHKYVWEYFTEEGFKEDGYIAFLETLALASHTRVEIGGTNGKTTKVKGSVYGGSESGFLQRHTQVTIKNNSEIGTTSGTTDVDGYVFGGGKGIEGYAAGGRVSGYTNVDINGGTMHGSVYGGGENGYVKGGVMVNMTGGTVNHDVYGGGALADTNTGNESAYIAVPDIPSNPKADGLYEMRYVSASGTAVADETYYERNDAGKYVVKSVGVGESVDGLYVVNYILTQDGSAQADKMYYNNTFNTTVNLTGGTIGGDAYGGGLGQKNGVNGATTDVEAIVYGDVLVELNKGVAKDATGCVVDRIFGANNVNGTPKGHVTVHVYATQNKDLSTIKDKKTITSEETTAADYDMTGVFGGGKSADYVPTDTKQSTEVIIEGCKLTSIYEVYGGGYGASTPGTDVLINGTKIIDKVFGGGYGAGNHEDPAADDYNPGANVGFRTDGTPYGIGVVEGNVVDEKTKIAIIQLKAGKVNSVFGGSNTLGDIRNGASITTLTTDDTGATVDLCDILEVGELFGGGNEAVMEGGAEIVLRCMPDSWIGEVYAGARKAFVGNDVSLTITSGKFGQVFGGNKASGQIDGYVEVNIEECPTCNTPVIIGELYGGGNLAPYTYSKLDSDPDYKSPRVNVRAFTSIGSIYGGGKGEAAVVTGNPTVSINVGMVDGGGQDYNPASDTSKPAGATLYPHEAGKIGVIGNVYGGGNEAKVNGSTNVFIGTEDYVKLDRIVVGETDVSNYYIRTGTSSNYVYTQVPRTKASAAGTYYQRNQSGTYEAVSVSAGDDVSGYYTRSGDEGSYVYTPVSVAQANTVYCIPVLGADIQGNVYGGGNAAKVTGNTNVVIGKEVTD